MKCEVILLRNEITKNYFYQILYVLNRRARGQSHRVSAPYHHEERQGDRGHVVGVRRLCQHGPGRCDRVRINAGRKKNHKT